MTPTPLHELTTRQRAVLLWIADHVQRLGYSPTYREGQAVFGFKSANGFRGHVIALVRKGLLTSDAGLCRSLRLADGVIGPMYPVGTCVSLGTSTRSKEARYDH